jgi:hypothetical protein
MAHDDQMKMKGAASRYTSHPRQPISKAYELRLKHVCAVVSQQKNHEHYEYILSDAYVSFANKPLNREFIEQALMMTKAHITFESITTVAAELLLLALQFARA